MSVTAADIEKKYRILKSLRVYNRTKSIVNIVGRSDRMLPETHFSNNNSNSTLIVVWCFVHPRSFFMNKIDNLEITVLNVESTSSDLFVEL